MFDPRTEEKLQIMRESLRVMHLAVRIQKEMRTRYSVKQHKVKAVEFSVGNYILRSRVDERKGPGKLIATWIGPYKVVEALKYAFMVEHLLSKERVHASRLKLYHDATLNMTRKLGEHVAAPDMLLGVDTIYEHRYNEEMQNQKLKVKWLGFEDIEDSWEPLDSVAADVPVLVK
ncbi:hypothetical protein Gpo141_00013953 [Globisporangium polare]